MNKLLRTLSWIFVCLGLLSLLISFTLFFSDKAYFMPFRAFNLETGNLLGGFISGVVGIFFSGTGTFLVFLTFEQQRSQFKISQFESSFFSLLSHLQMVIEQISGPVKNANIADTSATGRKFLYFQIRELKDKIEKISINSEDEISSKYKTLHGHFLFYDNMEYQSQRRLDTEQLRSFIQEVYDEFYKTRYSFLGHYFRFVYHVLKFVDESQLEANQKKKYIDLIQAQMTSDELGLLLFNGVGRFGLNKAYPLIEKYDFLSNLDTRVLPYPKLITQLYPKTNFKYIDFGS